MKYKAFSVFKRTLYVNIMVLFQVRFLVYASFYMYKFYFILILDCISAGLHSVFNLQCYRSKVIARYV